MSQKTLRHLEENSGSVAGIRFATAGAAVIQIQEHLESLLNNLV
jgi:hypothetical protein